MKVVRVRLVHTNKDLAKTESYLFDLVTDAAGFPRSELPFFGLWGQLAEPENCFPALLLTDGRIDFGTAWGSNLVTRHQRTNLRERRMMQGEMVTVWERDDHSPASETPYTLRVDRVTDLTALG